MVRIYGKEQPGRGPADSLVAPASKPATKTRSAPAGGIEGAVGEHARNATASPRELRAALLPPKASSAAAPAHVSAGLAPLFKVIGDARLSGQERLGALEAVLEQQATDAAALTPFLLPADPANSTLVKAAEQLGREPNLGNVQVYLQVFGAAMGQLNIAGVSFSAAELQERVYPVLRRTTRALLHADHVFKAKAELLSPGLAAELDADQSLSMLMETAARFAFDASRDTLVADILAAPSPVLAAYKLVEETLAGQAFDLAPVDLVGVARAYPGLGHALDLLRVETALMALTQRAGVTSDLRAARGRGLDGFLSRLMADTDAAIDTTQGPLRRNQRALARVLHSLHDDAGETHDDIKRDARRVRMLRSLAPGLQTPFRNA